MMKFLNAMLLCDFYKLSHRTMYPRGTEVVYSTWTPRSSRLGGVNEVVVFGHQAFIKDKLIGFFNEYFFSRPKVEIVSDYTRLVSCALGAKNPDTRHIEELHDFGYLPLSIKSLPEGSVVPVRTPVMTIQNTDPKFFWLTNYIETLASCELWQASTSATIARQFRNILSTAANETVGNDDFVAFQGHDFSMRGMSSLNSAVSSGMAHLLFFSGTDTIPAIQAAEHYYGANIERELVGTSIPATEHSIQCAYGDDFEYLKNMISVVHPDGFVSVVSDGYDFWDVMGRIVPLLKEQILEREGRLVIRPDSGDPVKIICGDSDGKTEIERKGAVEVLWDIFGGTVTDKGYRLLDSHIGLIYGDSITPVRAQAITDGLKAKGFASINVVFGIGSYTYQFNTRDTLGFALKSTLVVINGQEKLIYKDPRTDDGTKKSQRGRVAVFKDGETYSFRDGLGLNDVIMDDELVEVFRDGDLIVDQKFIDIKRRITCN